AAGRGVTVKKYAAPAAVVCLPPPAAGGVLASVARVAPKPGRGPAKKARPAARRSAAAVRDRGVRSERGQVLAEVIERAAAAIDEITAQLCAGGELESGGAARGAVASSASDRACKQGCERCGHTNASHLIHFDVLIDWPRWIAWRSRRETARRVRPIPLEFRPGSGEYSGVPSRPDPLDRSDILLETAGGHEESITCSGCGALRAGAHSP